MAENWLRPTLLAQERVVDTVAVFAGEQSDVKEFVEPLGMRILIRKDESRQKTRGGIVLPDDAEIPTITGRVVEVSVQVSNDEDFPIRKYDKVLFNPKRAIPVDFEPDNLLYVVPVEDVVAVFRKASKSSAAAETENDVENGDHQPDIHERDDLDEQL